MGQFRQSSKNRINTFSTVSIFTRPSGRLRSSILVAVGSVITLCWLGCEPTSQYSVDPSFGPPVLVQASTSVNAINTDTINVGTTRKPDDLLTIGLLVVAKVSSDPNRPVARVQMRIISPYDAASPSTVSMLDDGSGGDQVKGDCIFTARTTFQLQRVQIGVFTIEVAALGANDSRSNTLLLPLSIFRGNHAPQITLVEAADTVQLRNESQILVLRMRVSDEDGIGDISRVIFNSYRPDGSASSGNPFVMYDDGSVMHGDEKAGDGIFSLLITLPATTAPGTYRFDFQAVDRSNTVSNLLVHSMTVKP